MAKPLYCVQCGAIGAPKKHTKGSFGVEVLLWLCMIFPGVLYSLWRLTTRAWVCRTCGGAELIPPDSPRALAARHTVVAQHS